MAKAEIKQTKKRRRRGSINADDIVAGAFEVARGASIDQLSMPQLAEYLGVAVTSIYWHFRKKDELLNAMTDRAVEKQINHTPEVELEDSWQDVLRKHYSALRQLHREDEVLSELLMRTSTYSPEATRRTMENLEVMVAKLVDSGFTPQTALQTLSTLSAYTRGMINSERILIRSGAPTLDHRQVKMTDWSALPLLQSMVATHPLAGTSDADFEFGLARLFSGCEVMLSELPGNGHAARISSTAGSAPMR